jgi:Uma2 family endonuclease
LSNLTVVISLLDGHGTYGSFADMNVALLKRMTLAEFLDWEGQQPLRYEFDGDQPIAMTGGTLARALVQRDLAISVGGRLRGRPCQFVGNDLKVEVVGKIRYPDGFVFCSDSAYSEYRRSRPRGHIRGAE